jgi:predicted SAM-dependent methyltransferase
MVIILFGIVEALPPSVRRLAKLLPFPVKQRVLALLNYFSAIPYRGTGRYCPICRKTSNKFGRFGIDQRDNAQCMHCGSLERHRLVWLYLERFTDLFDGRPKTILHIAPEPAFVPRLRKKFGSNYVTADLFDQYAMVKMDVMDIHYADESFDLIYCSHVLEHVPDDRRALAEFHRTLRPDGWAILQVPIWREVTFEDPSIVDPAERLAVYGQMDHVRIYGHDFVDRVRDAGFKVKVVVAADFLSQDEIETMALNGAGEIYHCTKSTA